VLDSILAPRTTRALSMSFAQATIIATGSALAIMTAALGDHAHAQGKLDASYTISFARIRVGNISPRLLSPAIADTRFLRVAMLAAS
jgi:hypothetical protein